MKNIYTGLLFLMFSTWVVAQEYQVIDPTRSRIELDSDRLYFDDNAYLDDYHFADNIFALAQVGLAILCLKTRVLVISLRTSE